jgi:hypothetical protein
VRAVFWFGFTRAAELGRRWRGGNAVGWAELKKCEIFLKKEAILEQADQSLASTVEGLMSLG